MYKMLIYISGGNQITEQRAKAVILQEKVELALRKEIISGYKYYHKKLKLKKSFSSIYKLTDEQIEMLPSITIDEIKSTINELTNQINSMD
jgi:hypothetical protein